MILVKMIPTDKIHFLFHVFIKLISKMHVVFFLFFFLIFQRQGNQITYSYYKIMIVNIILYCHSISKMRIYALISKNILQKILKY